MEFNLFIIPMTLIIVELAKGLEINKKYLPDRQRGAKVNLKERLLRR